MGISRWLLVGQRTGRWPLAPEAALPWGPGFGGILHPLECWGRAANGIPHTLQWEQAEMSSNSIGKRSCWTWRTTSSRKSWKTFPRQWWSPEPWNGSNPTWMWHRGMCFGGFSEFFHQTSSSFPDNKGRKKMDFSILLNHFGISRGGKVDSRRPQFPTKPRTPIPLGICFSGDGHLCWAGRQND